MESSRKRSRSAMGSSTAQRGMWAQMNFSKAQPWADWGAMRIRRGKSDNIALVRPTRVPVSSKELPVKPMGIHFVACIPAEAGITVRH